MVNTKVTLCGIEIDNPLIPASGTFGYGKEFAELYDINCLGSFSFKGTTLEARFGNPLPRIAECSSGMINAVGLQNPGVKAVVEKELPEKDSSRIRFKPITAACRCRPGYRRPHRGYVRSQNCWRRMPGTPRGPADLPASPSGLPVSWR